MCENSKPHHAPTKTPTDNAPKSAALEHTPERAAPRVYIASSWKNQHAVELLTAELRRLGLTVLSFVENNHGEYDKDVPFEAWCAGEQGRQSFEYDTKGATRADVVIYVGPSGTDAWAEVGAAWAAGRLILGLWAKGEGAGLMRRMVYWLPSAPVLLERIAAAIERQRTHGGHFRKRLLWVLFAHHAEVSI
jgi:hypothetical protein